MRGAKNSSTRGVNMIEKNEAKFSAELSNVEIKDHLHMSFRI
jgi:hypothetical protein